MKHVYALTLLLACLCASCTSNRGAHFAQGTVSHVVVCYLKNSGNAADRAKVIEATKGLRDIPGVISIEVGKVLPSARPIVVNDYDVALVVTFTDKAAMDAYVTYPKHVEAVEKVLKPLTSKVVVYDFVNE